MISRNCLHIRTRISQHLFNTKQLQQPTRFVSSSALNHSFALNYHHQSKQHALHFSSSKQQYFLSTMSNNNEKELVFDRTCTSRRDPMQMASDVDPKGTLHVTLVAPRPDLASDLVVCFACAPPTSDDANDNDSHVVTLDQEALDSVHAGSIPA